MTGFTAGPYTLRRAAPADAPALALLGAATFLESYADLIPGPDLLAHCARAHSVAAYEGFLADPRTAVWLGQTSVACPAGFLVLIPSSLPVDHPDPDGLEILRIYALARYHGSGLARALMEEAASEARSRGAHRLWLGTHKANARALAFYGKAGFGVAGERRFGVGDSVFCDHVLMRPLAL